ncbi:MAG: DUF192 domain-containing protein [Actinobacteria bacterium]|nr:DUF192 domain-containing protein [Actinomycetota bacterium]
MHSLRSAKPLIALVVLAALFGAAATSSGEARSTATTLVLDGVPLRPELALTSESRALGLMHRRKAPADGMLFVFRHAESGGFWMKNTLVPLTIVFFDSRGQRVRRLSMIPCRRDPCPIYEPGKSYRYALELRASDSRSAKRLGPPTELRRLVRLAE